MPSYTCRCKESSGRSVRFVRSAENQDRLRSTLIAEGYIPISILGADGGRGRKVRMRLKEAQEFAETLALLLEGGHTLKEAMPLLKGFRPKGAIAEASESVSTGLEKGDTLRASLEKAPIAFPPGFISLAGIGETVGSLVVVMTHLGHHYKRLKALREKLVTAMVYPSLVLVVAVAAGIFLSLVTLPNLRSMMEAIENTDSSRSLATPVAEAPIGAIIIAGAALVALILFLILRRSNKGEEPSGVALRLPGVGSFLLNWNLMGWTFALEMLSSQGLPMDKALDEAAGAVAHPFLRQKMHSLAINVQKGDSLSDLLSREKIIPPVLSGWLRIGEQTGRVQKVFGTLREYFETRVNRSIDLATQLVEPTLIVLVGIGMIVVVSRFILPLFQMLGGLL